MNFVGLEILMLVNRSYKEQYKLQVIDIFAVHTDVCLIFDNNTYLKLLPSVNRLMLTRKGFTHFLTIQGLYKINSLDIFYINCGTLVDMAVTSVIEDFIHYFKENCSKPKC